jgi:hypothetical protein
MHLRQSALTVQSHLLWTGCGCYRVTASDVHFRLLAAVILLSLLIVLLVFLLNDFSNVECELSSS